MLKSNGSSSARKLQLAVGIGNQFRGIPDGGVKHMGKGGHGIVITPPESHGVGRFWIERVVALVIKYVFRGEKG